MSDPIEHLQLENTEAIMNSAEIAHEEDAQEESPQIPGTGRMVRPTNALDPLGSPVSRNPALSSLIRPDDPSTPERPRFPNFTQLPSRNTPLSELRMPSACPSSHASNKSTTPTSTPPRPSRAFGGAIRYEEPTLPARTGVPSLLEGLDLKSTTPTDSPPTRLQSFLDGSGDELPLATTPTRPRLSSSDSGAISGVTGSIDIPTPPRLPSLPSSSRGFHPTPSPATSGVSRTSTQLRKRGRSGENEEIERMERDEDQLDGGCELRSPTMMATRLPSNFGDFEHEYRDMGRTSASSTLFTTATSAPGLPARRLDLNAEFEQMTNSPAPPEETPSPDSTPNGPPNSPKDDVQPLQGCASRKGEFIPAGESRPIPSLNLTPNTHANNNYEAVAQQGESSRDDESRTPTERPSFRESTFFQRLDAQQQARVLDASAHGFYNLKEREVRMVVRQGVRIRDFAFEALMRGRDEEEETEAGEDEDDGNGNGGSEARSMQPSDAGTDVDLTIDFRSIPLIESPMTAATAAQNDGQTQELTREQSYRNIYGSFGYKRMIEKKRREEKDSSSSSSDDEWSGLVMGGRMGYGS